MVVGGLLDEAAGAHERVDGRGGGVGLPEERLAVDLTDELPVDLDARMGPDHLEIEHHPARPHCVDHVAEDVHDVPGFHSSERPRKDNEVERHWFDFDLPA